VAAVHVAATGVPTTHVTVDLLRPTYRDTTEEGERFSFWEDAQQLRPRRIRLDSGITRPD
jgi:hypothetical protein